MTWILLRGLLVKMVVATTERSSSSAVRTSPCIAGGRFGRGGGGPPRGRYWGPPLTPNCRALQSRRASSRVAQLRRGSGWAGGCVPAPTSRRLSVSCAPGPLQTPRCSSPASPTPRLLTVLGRMMRRLMSRHALVRPLVATLRRGVTGGMVTTRRGRLLVLMTDAVVLMVLTVNTSRLVVRITSTLQVSYWCRR